MKLLVPFLLLMVFFVGQTFAQTATATSVQNSTLYEGRFLPQEGDAPELVKSMLIRQASLAALVKELKIQELDSVLFVKKLDEAFLKEAADITERPKRLEKLLSFVDLTKIFESFQVKQEGVSPTKTNERFLRLEGKRNSSFAKEIYYKIIRDESYKFSSLILIPEIELVNCSYPDLFVQEGDVLLSSLGTSWKKWLGEGLAKTVAEIRIGNKLLEDKINKDLQEAKRSPEFEKSLYLRLKVRIEKIKENSTLGEREFSLKGEFGLLDLDRNLLVTSGAVEPTSVRVFIHGEKPASDLASSIYRFPLVSWASFFKGLESDNQKLETSHLQIKGVDSILKLLSLSKMLEAQGASLKLKATMDSYTGQEASYSLSYRGEKDALLSILKGLHQKNTEAGDQILYNPQMPFVLELKKAGGN